MQFCNTCITQNTQKYTINNNRWCGNTYLNIYNELKINMHEYADMSNLIHEEEFLSTLRFKLIMLNENSNS